MTTSSTSFFLEAGALSDGVQRLREELLGVNAAQSTFVFLARPRGVRAASTIHAFVMSLV